MVNDQASQMSFKEVVLIIFAISFVFLFPHFAFLPVPFLYVLPVLLVVWWFLKRSGENFTDIAFDFKRFEIKSIFVGAASAIVLFVFLQYVFFPLLSTIIELHPANLEDFKSIKHHPFNFIFILMAGFFVGGFYEEHVINGFVFTRIENIVKGKFVLPIAFILTNLIFGLYHFQLGTAGMLNAFVAGCAYQYLMIKFHRNLWYSIFFHAFFDAIGLTYIYLGIW
jgi:membrane protease YdiL (CAAX protease family)